MSNADYYPAGAAYDENAPYNEVGTPEIEAEVTVGITLERIATITTDEVYWDGDDWELCDDADTWKAYDYDYCSIPDMLDELVKYIDKELHHLQKFIKARTANKEERERYHLLNKMKESAVGWEEVDREMDKE